MKILFLKITDDYDDYIPGIESIGSLFGYDTEVYPFESFEKLKEHLCSGRKSDDLIDIIFVGAHSNMAMLSNDSSGSHTLTWKDFADHLCGCDGLTDSTKIYLGCCSGGFKRIALTMMARCPKIYKIAGVPCVLDAQQATLAFHGLLYGLNVEADDQQIQRMVTPSVGVSFNIHSRLEMVGELSGILTAQALWWARDTVELDFDFIELPFQLDGMEAK